MFPANTVKCKSSLLHRSGLLGEVSACVPGASERNKTLIAIRTHPVRVHEKFGRVKGKFDEETGRRGRRRFIKYHQITARVGQEVRVMMKTSTRERKKEREKKNRIKQRNFTFPPFVPWCVVCVCALHDQFSNIFSPLLFSFFIVSPSSSFAFFTLFAVYFRLGSTSYQGTQCFSVHTLVSHRKEKSSPERERENKRKKRKKRRTVTQPFTLTFVRWSLVAGVWETTRQMKMRCAMEKERGMEKRSLFNCTRSAITIERGINEEKNEQRCLSQAGHRTNWTQDNWLDAEKRDEREEKSRSGRCNESGVFICCTLTHNRPFDAVNCCLSMCVTRRGRKKKQMCVHVCVCVFISIDSQLMKCSCSPFIFLPGNWSTQLTSRWPEYFASFIIISGRRSNCKSRSNGESVTPMHMYCFTFAGEAQCKWRLKEKMHQMMLLQLLMKWLYK